MGNRADESGPATGRKPPQNPIIGKDRAEKWDQAFEAIMNRQDWSEESATDRHAKGQAAFLFVSRKLDSLTTWSVIRDIIVILLLVALCSYVGYRAYRFDQATQMCDSMSQLR